jgi:hypothetical protein
MNNVNKTNKEDGPPTLSNKKKLGQPLFAVMNAKKAKLGQPLSPSHFFFASSAGRRSFRSAWSENGF